MYNLLSSLNWISIYDFTENIDFTALLISYPSNNLLKVLESVYTAISKARKTKKPVDKALKARNFFTRKADICVDESELILQQKLFNLIEQWLKFLSRPPLVPGEDSTEFRMSLLNFCKSRVRRDHLMILKGLNQQVGNHQRFLEPMKLHAGPHLSSIWEEESAIKSVLEINVQVLAEQMTIVEANFHSRVR